MKASFVHQTLGPLAYDQGLNWYEGSAFADGDRFPIRLSLDDCDDESALFAVAERRVARLTPIIQAAKQFAAASLFEKINSEWLVSRESSLSFAELVSRFLARSYTLYPDGAHEIALGPEALFSGHSVLVCSDPNGDFTEASIAG